MNRAKRTHDRRLSVLHGKFFAYLAWSQPFLYELIMRLNEHVDGWVVCSRADNRERFPTPRLFRLGTRYLVDPLVAVLAAREVKAAVDPDLLHAHFGWSGVRMVLLRQFLKVPLVTTFGGRDVSHQIDDERFRPLYRVLLEISEAMVCVSEELRSRLVERGVDERRVHVIRRGVDLDRFAFHDRSGRDVAAPLRTVMVGRLVEKKGHRFAVEALARLAATGIRARLVVVGDGEGRRPLLGLARRLGVADRLELVGATDQDGVVEQLRRADVLVQSSVTAADGDTEGLPNVVVEAAATGLPVVGTRHGGIVEAVRDGETGRLVPERDVEALSAALAELAAARERRLDMGRRGAALMRAEYDIERQVERQVELYEELVERYPPESERMGRVYVDDRFVDDAAVALRPVAAGRALSLSELVFWARAGRHRGVTLAGPEPRLWERFYRLATLLPEIVKRPVEQALVRLFLPWMKRRHGFDPVELNTIRRSAIELAREPDGLERLARDWSALELAAHLASEERRGGAA